MITGNIADDFIVNHRGGGRCACCHRMQPREVHMYWVSDSATYYKTDGYNRLAYTSKQATSKTCWCIECIEKTKTIKDNFTVPVTEPTGEFYTEDELRSF